MQIRSASVYWHSSPTKNPLLRMLWWDSVAPLGNPVVPEVYWMLIGSSALSVVLIAASAAGSAPRSALATSSHSALPSRTTCSRSGQDGRTSSIIAA